MQRKQAGEYSQEVLDLFDGYVHGSLTRRDFIDRATRVTVHRLRRARRGETHRGPDGGRALCEIAW